MASSRVRIEALDIFDPVRRGRIEVDRLWNQLVALCCAWPSFRLYISHMHLTLASSTSAPRLLPFHYAGLVSSPSTLVF